MKAPFCEYNARADQYRPGAGVDRVWSDAAGRFIDRPENVVPEHLREGVRILLLLEMRPASERIQ